MKPIDLIKLDFYRYTEKVKIWLTLKNLITNRSFKYTFLLSHSLIVRLLVAFSHRLLSIKYSLQVPEDCRIGPGLYIKNATSIAINRSAKIGSNHGEAENIGNKAYIEPNVCLEEHIHISNKALMGIGSVVTIDVLSNTTFADNPAKCISKKCSNCYILNSVNVKLESVYE
ncbi:hypothetical protein PVK63_08890 [Aliivibrio sp. S2TY2]|uniref:hypothetical protein n=1 Tax=unclassified Aliivibrio TaxID=2645654 RepID=UPI0023791DF2|nr:MULTISPECIES: hypothetical protein [unclassified Aliivibrio]MDD9174988.1 hypothetical protein [Aliivibrio sp. S3TY1]MDD9192065.1 hypothetical protein [Aliivibrio sp. S2TY2]